MKNRILKFTVKDQRISSDEVSVVADSRNYLLAWFFFDNTWDGVEKTAVFSQGETVYNMVLTDDMCRIPAEVITGDGFFVSVFGGDLITADKIKISVTPSGLAEGAAPPEPTQSVYDQLLTLVASERAAASTFADEAGESANSAALAAQQAYEYCESVEINQKAAEEYIARAEEERAQYEQNIDVRLDALEEKTSDVVKTTDIAETDMDLYNGDELLASRKATLDALMNLETHLSGSINANTNQISALEQTVTTMESTVSMVPHIYGDYLSKSQDLDYDVYQALDGAPLVPTTSAVLSAINGVKAENKFRVISSGELDDTTGGVESISAEITEDITGFTEFALFIEMPQTAAVSASKIYLNAYIDGNTQKNLFYNVYNGAAAAGSTLRSFCTAKVYECGENKYIGGVGSLLSAYYGNNTRSTNTVNVFSPWQHSTKDSYTLTINTNSGYPFESGTKWTLEAR